MKILRNRKDNSVNQWNAVLAAYPEMQEMEMPAEQCSSGFVAEDGTPLNRKGEPVGVAVTGLKPARRGRGGRKKAAEPVLPSLDDLAAGLGDEDGDGQ